MKSTLLNSGGDKKPKNLTKDTRVAIGRQINVKKAITQDGEMSISGGISSKSFLNFLQPITRLRDSTV
jgi:hypothetical protein